GPERFQNSLAINRFRDLAIHRQTPIPAYDLSRADAYSSPAASTFAPYVRSIPSATLTRACHANCFRATVVSQRHNGRIDRTRHVFSGTVRFRILPSRPTPKAMQKKIHVGTYIALTWRPERRTQSM